MQNIIAALFEVESEGYQAITMLRQAPVTDRYAILEMELIKRRGNTISVCDKSNSGIHTSDDTIRGGLIGSFIGILGGPIGVLLCGSAGALTGSIIDASDEKNSTSMLETVAAKMNNDTIALVILAEELTESDIDSLLNQFKVQAILRFDAAHIATEVAEAEKLQAELEKQARAQLRKAKKDEFRKNIEEHRAKIAEKFADLKAKLKK